MTKNDKRPVFVEFHFLRSFPPSNLNRDDLGSPKTAIFGGERRLRISSQCLKRTWRTSSEMKGEFADTQLGVRTSRLPSTVLEQLGTIDAESQKGVLSLLASLGRKKGKPAKDDQNDEELSTGDDEEGGAAENKDVVAGTAHLLFLSRQEIDLVAKFAKANLKNLAALTKKAPPKKIDDLRKDLAAFLTEGSKRNAVDIGLFGRFFTSDEIDNIDGALHVAHAIGTQKVEIEYDYFTAVDDLQQSTGAGHLGESEFASSVMYLYAACDLGQLQNNLGERKGDERIVDKEARLLAARSLGAIVKAACCSTPTGKRTGTAPYAPAEYVEVVLRRGQPVSYANAFTSSVKAKDGDVMDRSIQKLVAHREVLEKAFDAEPQSRFVLSLRDVAKGDHGSLKALADAVQNRIIELEAASR